MLCEDSSAGKLRDRKHLFPTTRWTIVQQMGNGEKRIRFVAWDEFCNAYRRPLHIWLLARTGNAHDAEELTQSFFTKLHLKEHVLENLNSGKGQLRSWLLTCLRRHWIDEWRKKSPVETSSLDEDIPANSPDDPDEIYDREWALSLSRRVITELRDEYIARGKSPLFDALLQTLDQPSEINRRETADTLGISENHFAVAYMRFQERLAVRLRQEVAATIFGDDPAEIDAELRHLIRILSRNGGIGACFDPSA